jgi:hypothetical protein
MAKKDYYLPETDLGKVTWLSNFAQKLPGHATALGISATTLAQVASDEENFAKMVLGIDFFAEYSKQLTAYKNQLRSGTLNNAPIGDLPAPPTAITFTTPPVADVFGRTRRLVQTIKNNPNYTEAIGQDLGIIGSENEFDPNTLKPELKIETAAGGRPNIIWKKGQTEGIKIKVDRGSGTFEFLAIDTQPNYLDTHPLPPLGQTATWRYTAIYLLNDEEAGQWSDIVSVTVVGQP